MDSTIWSFKGLRKNKQKEVQSCVSREMGLSEEGIGRQDIFDLNRLEEILKDLVFKNHRISIR